MASSHSTAYNALVVAPLPELPADDPDSLAEAFEACDGDIELLEPIEL